MIARNARVLERSLDSVRSHAARIHRAVVAMIALYCAIIATSACLLVYSVLYEGADLPVFPLVLSAIILAVSLVFLKVTGSIFKNIARGHTPFTSRQATRMQAAGFLLIAKAVLEVVLSLVPPIHIEMGDVTIGFSLASDVSAGVHLDFASLIWAMLCFSLAYIFRYGTLLQKLSDDTI